MKKHFSPILFAAISNRLRQRSDELEYVGDLSDLGNELGIIIGEHFDDIDKNDLEIFFEGFKHGISLSNKGH